MSNDCDIEELKHIALQKFIELADVDSWDRSLSYPYYKCGAYMVTKDSENPTSYTIQLGSEYVFAAFSPQLRTIATTKTGKPNKSDVEKAQREFEEAVREFEAIPAIIAIRKIEDRQKEKDCREREATMKKAMEESCKRLQEVLTETTPSFAERMRESRKRLDDLWNEKLEFKTKRWWEVWK